MTLSSLRQSLKPIQGKPFFLQSIKLHHRESRGILGYYVFIYLTKSGCPYISLKNGVLVLLCVFSSTYLKTAVRKKSQKIQGRIEKGSGWRDWTVRQCLARIEWDAIPGRYGQTSTTGTHNDKYVSHKVHSTSWIPSRYRRTRNSEFFGWHASYLYNHWFNAGRQQNSLYILYLLCLNSCIYSLK